VPGVVDVERVRVRRVGPTIFVELSLAVSRTLPLDRLAELKQAVSRAIEAELPGAEVSVITTPRALDDETVVERVLVIARNRGLAVHHVTVHAIGDRLAVSLDLEVPGHLTLAAAHEIADGLENAIQAELGSEVEVETHIEPLEIEGVAGQDAGSGRVEELRAALAELAAQLGPLRDVHEVRARKTSQGEIVNFHCQVDPSLTVEAVHEAVDEVERALKRRWPNIKRVIGHAEPRV
jgi:divalent metal cation (Fe/Co/Zn/Cd) transporter